MSAYIIGGCNVLSFDNTHFTFSEQGYFRLFDNDEDDEDDDDDDDNHRLFINIYVQSPEYLRWQYLGYAMKVYIKYADNTITINTGFRGSSAQVIENNGFEYTDVPLDFDDAALRYSCTTRFSSSDEHKIEEYLENNPSDSVPTLVRNMISINISADYCVHIENVNKFNLQPCRIKLMINADTKSNKDLGIFADRRYFSESRLISLTDDSYLDNRKSVSGIVETEESVYTDRKWE